MEMTRKRPRRSHRGEKRRGEDIFGEENLRSFQEERHADEDDFRAHVTERSEGRESTISSCH